MTLKSLTLFGSVALAALVTSTAHAAGRGGGSGHSGMSGGAASARIAPSATGTRQFAGRSGGWHGRTGGDGFRYRHHHPRYGGYYGGYPYYGFGYGYPFGYGYGYPYFGASAELYYNGYRGYDRGYEYDDGERGSVAANVQQRLARAGYYRGPIDGVIGNGTRQAIRAYERANRLPVDGRIDRDLLARMGLS